MIFHLINFIYLNNFIYLLSVNSKLKKKENVNKLIPYKNICIVKKHNKYKESMNVRIPQKLANVTFLFFR